MAVFLDPSKAFDTVDHNILPTFMALEGKPWTGSEVIWQTGNNLYNMEA